MDIEKIKNNFNKYIVSVMNQDSFNKYFVNVIKTHYTDFQGRASRSEYWYYVLFYTLISIPLSILDSIVFGRPILGLVLSLALLVPSIAVAVRRIHDLGKPWFWLLIGLIPFLGAFALIYFFCQPGENKKNQWGTTAK